MPYFRNVKIPKTMGRGLYCDTACDAFAMIWCEQTQSQIHYFARNNFWHTVSKLAATKTFFFPSKSGKYSG